MPLSPTSDAVGRHQRREALGDGERRLEGAEVAVVDADQPARRGASARSSSASSWTSTSTSMPRSSGGVLERARLVVVDAGHDDQDAVGAQRPGLVDLIGLEEEVLAEHRQRDGGAGGDEVLRRALEERARR